MERRTKPGRAVTLRERAVLMRHEHVALHVAPVGGLVYEVCECGASRRRKLSDHDSEWHACGACVGQAALSMVTR